MKTPKAVKMKSGNWRVQLQVDGKRYSCTGETKKEAQNKAKKLYAGIVEEKRVPLTVGKAIDKYIEAKTGTLSPSTIRGYQSIRKNYLQDLMEVNLSDLTSSDIQIAISNEAARGKSSKTIRNAHGLLSAVLDEYNPDFLYKTSLPQNKKTECRILTEEEMSKVWQAARGSKYELPILFASWLGMRMSEVRGVKYRDIQNGRMHIHTAVVKGPDGDIEKGPKTTSGDRWIKLPETIHKLIGERYASLYTEDGKLTDKGADDYICPYADVTIYKNFVTICRKAGVEPCRFHDLRHFAASEALALGVPDKYTVNRMGHKTDYMLKTVYQHQMQDKVDEFGDMIDGRMEELYRADDFGQTALPL